jgi:dCMP deaminase
MNWTEYFIRKAELTAEKSKDPSTKTGVVIVGADRVELTSGFNGFPRGVDDDVERYDDRPTKYKFMAHAETNAIHNAARYGIAVKGAYMYTSFGVCTCQECAKAVIQAGIVRLIGRKIEGDFAEGRWNDTIQIGITMLIEAGVELLEWDGEKLTNVG